MDRALSLVAVLLIVCLVLPTLAHYAAEAVPVLLALLAVLVLLRGFDSLSDGRR